MIVQVILAAGEGSRVGGNKGAMVVGGVSLLTRLLDAAARSKVDATIVVTGAEAERVEALCARPRVVAVRNADYRRGQTSSLKTGLRALPKDADAFLIHPVDHCLVGTDVLDALVDAWLAAGTPPLRIVRPKFGDDWGHPVLYAAAFVPEFLAVSDDASARVVYRAHLAAVVAAAVKDDACLFDLDTPEDLQRLRARLELR